jgi:hypothetical protein
MGSYSRAKTEEHDKLTTKKDAGNVWFCFRRLEKEANLKIFEEQKIKSLLQEYNLKYENVNKKNCNKFIKVCTPYLICSK